MVKHLVTLEGKIFKKPSNDKIFGKERYLSNTVNLEKWLFNLAQEIDILQNKEREDK